MRGFRFTLPMADQVHYVYAVVDAGADTSGAPLGIDDRPIQLLEEGRTAALVSLLDASVYAGPEVESRSGDIEWLGPRARAHDAAVTWASERAAVVPLPMFSLFRDAEGVRAMLRERQDALIRTLDRVRNRQEYGVRLFRIDDALTARLAEMSPRIAELERAAEAASPGQRYLLTRKLETERAEELRRIGGEIAQRSFDRLRTHAAAAVLDSLPRRTLEGMAGTAVLNASFLLQRDASEAFRRELTGLVQEYEPRGFRFEFTGPWPPYHFVRETTDEQ
jgi:hypothetical protein